MTETQQDNLQEGVDLAAAGVGGWIAVLRQVKKKRTELDEIEQQAREKIQDALGERVDGFIDGRKVVRWSHTAPPVRFDKKAFGKAHPALLQEFTIVGEPGRRFEVLDPEGDDAK